MPFSTGHRPPREGRGEVLGDIVVGVVVFRDRVEMPEEVTEIPVGVPDVTLEVGRGDRLAALFEEERIVVVLLGNDETPVVEGTVEALAREVDTVTVVVISSKAVPEMVPS